MSEPRVSILIPNFNNGKESSRDGKHDMINDLMLSLYNTLINETTAFEIIAYDDGSTDDSLKTLQKWAQTTWNDGTPVLSKLITAEHCGILSVNANKLVEASSGEYLVRLDGDVVLLTPNWVTKLCEVFDNAPADLGVLGPKQLGLNQKIHAFGDCLLHPIGYHHIGNQANPQSCNKAIEVDHVMGCCYCCKREVHDDLGGYDERILRGQTVDFGLRARLNGWKCWAIPQIEFEHRHGLRKERDTKADHTDGLHYTLNVFRKKWGFDRISPDLDYVRKNYAGTPLLWNANVFGVSLDEQFYLNFPSASQSIPFEESEWVQFAQNANLQKLITSKFQFLNTIFEALNTPLKDKRIGLIGEGASVLGHLLANQGYNFVGTDFNKDRVQHAQKSTEAHQYPSQEHPQFIWQNDWRRLPLEDNSLDLIIMLNIAQSHPNPVSLYNEASRVLGSGNEKFMLITVPAIPPSPQFSPTSSSNFTYNQLITQVVASGSWFVAGQNTNSNPTMAFFKRTDEPHPAPDHTPEMLAYAHEKYALQQSADCLS